jgi:hypothetical protein
MAIVLDGTTGITSPAADFDGNVTLGSSVLATPTGSAPSYTCRAWVNFNGTGTVAIRASGNVSSITDGGVGIYTVNFTTAMPDVNYAATGGASTGLIVSFAGHATGSTPIRVRAVSTAAATDSDEISVAIFR